MGGRSGQSISGKRKTSAAQISEGVDKIDNLPQGKIFDDAKRIDGVFKKSTHGYSDTIEAFESNSAKGELKTININEITITQPNIQGNKIKNMLSVVDNITPINVVQFKDGEKAIFDGHHRLMANWALGRTEIRVNLVEL